jgi:hypothetical protein
MDTISQLCGRRVSAASVLRYLDLWLPDIVTRGIYPVRTTVCKNCVHILLRVYRRTTNNIVHILLRVHGHLVSSSGSIGHKPYQSTRLLVLEKLEGV